MPKSLLEQLPEIVANGRKQAERILESLESRQRVRLQTRELVLPAKDSAARSKECLHRGKGVCWQLTSCVGCCSQSALSQLLDL